MFFPGDGELQGTPRLEGAAYEDFSVTTEDGETLHGWWVPHLSEQSSRQGPEQAPGQRQPRGTVLFCHGNAGAIDLRLDYVRLYRRLGMNLILWDYRGYGRSTGSPTEAGMYRDVAAIWQYAQDHWGVRAESTIVHGRSLGGGVASWLTDQDVFAGLLLEATFTSAADLAQEKYPIFPARLMLRHHYATLPRLQRGDEPLLLLHSRDDDVIPYAHAERNFVAARVADKQLIPFWGPHNYGVSVDDPKYYEPIDQFISRVLNN